MEAPWRGYKLPATRLKTPVERKIQNLPGSRQDHTCATTDTDPGVV